MTNRHLNDLAVCSGLLLADQRILVFRFGFEDDQRRSFLIKQQEIDKSGSRVVEIVTQGVKMGFINSDN